MGVGPVVTLGFGTFGSIGLVVTLGFLSGGVTPAVSGPYRTLRTAAFLAGGDVADTWRPGGEKGKAFVAGPGTGEGTSSSRSGFFGPW